ncbi:M48 family metallopeptidase [Glutamicibacter ectropisis]|uniref:M48 family metallopeptidase n=1 Tax=Glutamicibacter ectropisis TaxID=3046593 RepID=A0AAU6WA15_9MICC
MPASPRIFEFVSPDDIPVRVERSTKRRKTISSQWRDETLIIQVPAALDERTERSFVEEMLKKYRNGRQRRDARHTDSALERRAHELDQHYFDGSASPTTVRWVTNQNKRWGSASYQQRSIRLSSKLQQMPTWVRDYVLVHELAHLASPRTGHGPEFQKLLNKFERRSEADLYLEAFHAGYSSYAKEQGRPADELEGFGDDVG